MCAMWTDDDVRTLHGMAADFGEDFPINLVKLMAHESGCSPAAHNPGGAVGLIQFEPDTLRGLGWTQGSDAFAKLSVAEQLPYVRRYLLPHRDAIRAGGLGVLYTVVFLPALASRAVDQTYVLCALHGPLAWAYSANATFDADGKGWITPHDLVVAAEAFYARTSSAQDLATRVAKLDAPPDTMPEPVPDAQLLPISGGTDPEAA